MARRETPRAPRPRRRGAPGAFSRSLQLFGEVLLAGVLVFAGSLLLVTAVPALAAGVGHVRREITGRQTSVRRFWAEWWAATRSLWPLGLAAVALAVLLAGDWQLARSGVVPGAPFVALVVALFAAGAVAVVLRAAGTWTDGEGEPVPGTARSVLRAASDRTVDDLPGAALLIGAVVMTVALLWMLPLLVLIVGGLLCLAVVGVETRRRPGRP